MKEQSGIWDKWTAETYHESSPLLAQWLIDFLPNDRVVNDFGCGNGYYLGELEKRGYDCVGFEGSKLDNFKCSTVYNRDLREPLACRKGHCISMEVLEHIDKKYEQIFLDTITGNCNGKLILSWALPGQPGIGHVNCQPQEYAISEVERRGFNIDMKATLSARQNIDDNCDWFRRTLLVFSKI